MKSQEKVLLHVVEGLLADVRLAYPAYKGIDLDYKRIALGCRSRGLGYFTLDLPNLDQLLLSGLESGRLSLSGPCSSRVSKRIQVPKLFSGLWLRVFDNDARLKQDVDPTALAFIRQLSVIGKKLEVGCSPERRNDVLRNYHDVERSLRLPTLRWEEDEIDANHATQLSFSDCFHSHCSAVEWLIPPEMGDDRDKHLLLRLQQVADIVVGSLGSFDPIQYSLDLEEAGQGIGFKHGPGAVAERLKNWEKSQFPNWPQKLEACFPFTLSAHAFGDTREQPLNHEVASRLISVPKTSKGPRLIAAEPVAHQWCQQIIWRWLREALKRNYRSSFIDFRRQDLSASMVLRASADRSLATVDLSDASDRLSCWTVERVFRSNTSILIALHAARTRYLRDDISENRSFIKLKKFASQGTATTFPVQSIVFLCIALASCFDEKEPTKHSIRRLRNQVRVYGDDIIIPRHAYARLLRLMGLLQLKVNVAKSYVNGQFRESCGQDGFAGYDVTPCKPKVVVGNGPDSFQAVIDTSNNLFNKGYWNASSNILSHLPAHLLRCVRIVGVNESGFAGLTSFCGGYEHHLKQRWNTRLHRYEARVWSLSPTSSKETRQGFAPFVDFVSRPYNPEHARVVSEYGRTRKTRSRLLWEPLNMGSHRVDYPTRCPREASLFLLSEKWALPQDAKGSLPSPSLSISRRSLRPDRWLRFGKSR